LLCAINIFVYGIKKTKNLSCRDGKLLIFALFWRFVSSFCLLAKCRMAAGKTSDHTRRARDNCAMG